jgi:hypothetical protein
MSSREPIRARLVFRHVSVAADATGLDDFATRDVAAPMATGKYKQGVARTVST